MLTSNSARSRVLLFATLVRLSSIHCPPTQLTLQQEDCRRQVDRVRARIR